MTIDRTQRPAARPRAPGKTPARARRRARRPVARARRKRSWWGVCGWSLGSLVLLAFAAGAVIYALFSTGILTVDMARPYVERALERQIGGGHKVAIGAITADRDADGETLLRVSDVVVSNASGDIVASAPSADVTLENDMVPWMATPRRIDLVGAELSVKINAQGTITVAAGRDAKPLQAPTRVAPPASAAGEASPAAAAPAEPAAAAAPIDPLNLSALAVLAENLDKGGFDGAALAELGLKDGRLIVESEISGRRWTFEHIGLSIVRPPGGGMTLNLRSSGTDGPWSTTASLGALVDGRRSVSLAVRDLAPRDLLIAAGKADEALVADSPLSMQVALDIDGAGRILAAKGDFSAGAGNLQLGTDAAGRMVIDEASLRVTLDPARRVIVIDELAIHAGALDTTLAAEIDPPDAAGDPWRVAITGGKALLSGGGPDAHNDPPLLLDKLDFAGRFETEANRFVIEKGDISGPSAAVKLSGELDLGAPKPFLALTTVGSPMSVTSLKRLWPIVAAPDVRKWIFDHVAAGDVKSATIAFNAPLDSIGNKDKPLPAEGLSLEITGTSGVLRPVPGLPPIREADVTVQATGRSAHVVASKAVMETAGGRRLSLTESVLDVPDTAADVPEGKVQVRIEGPAAAAVELAALPVLRGSSSMVLDPATVRGNIAGTAQVNLKIRPKMGAEDVDFAFEADLTSFAADKVIKGQRIEGATVKVFATPDAVVLRGEGKLGGAPASFDMRRPRGNGDIEFRVAANLDDAARNRMDLDLAGLSGTVVVKLAGKLGERETRADVELDLTGARLAELIPGWSKPAGKPAKLTARATVRGDGTRLDDLVVTGTGVNIRGTLDLDGDAKPISANLPTFQLSDGDRANVRIERVDGAPKITVRGDVIEARAFLKSLLDAPVAGRRGEKPADIDLDVNLGVVAGNNGETMRDAVLRMSRRNGELRTFTLSAVVGQKGAVMGDLKVRENGRPMLQIVTSDAGALLRFVDFYAKLYGGELWVRVDAPRGDGGPQDGIVNLRNFVIRGEPGLDRLIAAAPAGERGDGTPRPGSTVAFSKLQVDFQRSAGKLTIRDGAIWGTAIGSTFDGTLDFAADRASVRGTYVPAYGLNNLFSKLPVLGFFLGGGPNEGLVGVTYEIVGPLSGPTLRVNPISAVAPGFLRKIFEFRESQDPRPPQIVAPTR
ncbi:YhdP family protein [Ancylobacter terrae]|uniref:YhdP family protein n=1 Tax=Ancylobacter sp. sgz301288 TaxID=3342077 RepID=UPI00385A7C55